MPARRPRVAYLCPEAPYPRDSGGRHRVDVLRRALGAAADVSLVVVGERPPLPVRLQLRAERARVFPPKREDRVAWALRCLRAAVRREAIPAARYLSPRRIARVVAHVRSVSPDLVVLGDAYLTAFLPHLRPLGARIVIDTHDAASVVHARIAEASRSLPARLMFRALAWNTAHVERTLFPRADEVWTLSEDDARFYREQVRIPRVVVAPNVVDVGPAPATVAPEEPRAAVFVGSFAYWPNEDAALRLIELSRGLHAAGALSRLYLVGIHPTARMHAAAAGLEHVVVTGRVPDVRPYLARAAVVAAPLSAGSGVKVKLLEAMALARPVVTTPIGAEGIRPQPGVEAEVASLEAFPRVLGEVLVDPARQERLARAGRRLVEERFSMRALERVVAERLEALTAGVRG